ncbi:TniQ family protein [Nonomuraea sp. NPDC003707]
MDVDPLPRSLDPLPGESLRGYVLRLSYRLEISPAQLTVLTGLMPAVRRLGLPAHLPHQIPSCRLAFFDDASALGDFAESTRMTRQEAENLQMRSFSPLQLPDRGKGASDDLRRAAFETPWVFTAASRWCPQCLAGDGSPIQTEFGGSWRKQWHLPVVFICPEHMTVLAARCGVCGHTTSAQSPPCAVGRATDPSLHPLRCRATVATVPQKVPYSLRPRTPACAATLTDLATPPLEVADLRRLLKLQTRLLQHIEPGQPTTEPPTVLGRAVDPLQYLTDTALTAGLILLSWPATRRLCPSRTLAAAIDTEVELRLRQSDASSAAARRGFRSPWAAPPTDALACAALLCITHKLLGKPSPDSARDTFQELIDRAKHDPRTANAIRTSSRRSSTLAEVFRRAPMRGNMHPPPPPPRARSATSPLTGLELLTDRYATGPAALAWHERGELLPLEAALAAARADPSPTPDIALALVKLTMERRKRILRELDRDEYEALTIARNLPKPVSWAELGAAVGMSTQGIHQQYARQQLFVTRSYRRTV